jgi:hypothetical protein
MIVAFAPECRVNSIAHVVALGQFPERADCGRWATKGAVYLCYQASSSVVCGVDVHTCLRECARGR